MNLENQIKSLCQAICDFLRQAGHESDASDLSANVKKLLAEDSSVRLTVYQNIQNSCHIRAFGDIYIAELELEEWWGMLGQLNQLSKRYLERYTALRQI